LWRQVSLEDLERW
jgi:hypothetical protein